MRTRTTPPRARWRVERIGLGWIAVDPECSVRGLECRCRGWASALSWRSALDYALAQAAAGAQAAAMSSGNDCPICGPGYDAPHRMCDACGGTGDRYDPWAGDWVHPRTDCLACGGSGEHAPRDPLARNRAARADR